MKRSTSAPIMFFSVLLLIIAWEGHSTLWVFLWGIASATLMQIAWRGNGGE